MTTLNYNGHTVVLNDSINDLPIQRHVDFNRHLMADAEIGSNGSDMQHRLNRIKGFIKRGENEKALIEVSNADKTLKNCISGLSPKMMSFAVLVEEIDGTRCENHNDAGLKRILLKLSTTNLVWSKLEHYVNKAKKKWTRKSPFSFRTRPIRPMR